MNYISVLNKKSIRFRVKILTDEYPSDWSSWIGQPTPGYLEISEIAPYSLKEIEFLEIDPVERKYIGKLVPSKEIDHSPDIEEILTQVGISFQRIDGAFRVAQTELYVHD